VASLTVIVLLFAEESARSCVLFTAKVIVVIIELTSCAATAHVVVRSCRKFEKQWHRAIHALIRLHGVVLN
jgi:hypothetical protein